MPEEVRFSRVSPSVLAASTTAVVTVSTNESSMELSTVEAPESVTLGATALSFSFT